MSKTEHSHILRSYLDARYIDGDRPDGEGVSYHEACAEMVEYALREMRAIHRQEVGMKAVLIGQGQRIADELHAARHQRGAVGA